jgi:hypothetical protein
LGFYFLFPFDSLSILRGPCAPWWGLGEGFRDRCLAKDKDSFRDELNIQKKEEHVKTKEERRREKEGEK